MTNAKLADVKHGDTLIADAGFTCLDAGQHEVKTDATGAFYVDCADGSHYLSGQKDQAGNLVGMSKPLPSKT